jgi:hypothetical protein
MTQPDLKIEYQQASKGRNITNEWTRGHQDANIPWNDIQELKDMKLSNTAILNTWCDKMANEARRTHIAQPDADIYPCKKWALFTCYPTLQKITGQLDEAIIEEHH